MPVPLLIANNMHRIFWNHLQSLSIMYCIYYFATLFPTFKAGHSRTIVMRVVSIEALRNVGRDKSCWVDARHINHWTLPPGIPKKTLRKPAF